MKTARLKAYAYYLPQFHETHENNSWWGKGFTEWTNVVKATPLFPGHFQPRVPFDGKYYDLSQPDAINTQARLARHYGISGFGIYHYWYEGKRLLSKPLDIILANRDIDIEIYLCWANHSWTRAWKNSGAANDVLIRQTYEKSPSERLRHYSFIAKAMSDSRYAQIDGKCFFQIYQPCDIPDFAVYMQGLRRYVWDKLRKDIHISGMISHAPPNRRSLSSLDSITLFQPGSAIYNNSCLTDSFVASEPKAWVSAFIRNLPDVVKKPLYLVQRLLGDTPSFYDYSSCWKKMLKQSALLRYYGKDLIAGAFVDFDNTARYKNRAKIFIGATPETFEAELRSLADLIQKRFVNKILIINAWNEWAEGAYLEPDSKYGHAYLESIKRVLSDVNV